MVAPVAFALEWNPHCHLEGISMNSRYRVSGRRALNCSMLLLLLPSSFAATQPTATNFRDGIWEMTLKSDVPGVQSMPPMVLKRCITAKEMQDLQAKATQPPGADQCKVLEQKTSGATTTWKIECTGKTKIKGAGTVTVGSDTYSMQSQVSMVLPEGKTMDIKSSMTGKRLGECKP